MNGLLLRLAGPLMAFGEHAAFHYRDTAPFPTRSSLIGMFAAASGRLRHEALHPHHDLPGTPSYTDLVITVRVDRPGTRYTDFHTAGGGRAHGAGLRTSSGGYRAQKNSTLISHRVYLADAVFTAAVQGPDPLLERIADDLEHPHWAPYLGRRACVPDEPLVLRPHTADPIGQLLQHVPLSLPRPPRAGQDTTPVHFLWEDPPPHVPAAQVHRELPDDPADLTPTHRRYRIRQIWRTTENLPTTLYAGPYPLDRLTDYVLQEHP